MTESSRFYLWVEEKVTGPFTIPEVLARPELRPETLVCAEGVEVWRELLTIEEFSGATASAVVLPCSACGAPIAFGADDRMASCAFCGAKTQYLPGEHTLVKMECSHCGAGLEYEEGMTGIPCNHCGRNFFLSSGGAVTRYLAKARLTLEHARQIVGEALVRVEASPVRVSAPSLCYESIWIFSSVAYSWDVDEEKPGRKKLLRKKESLAFPDIAAEETGVLSFNPAHFHLNLEPYRDDRVELEPVHPAASGEEALAHARLLRRMRGRDEEGEEYDLTVETAERLSLIYYPFWLVPYEAAGRRKTAFCDARRGYVTNLVFGERREETRVLDRDTFSPLTLQAASCPRCASDLPLAGADYAAPCANCGALWKTGTTPLDGLSYRILEPSVRKKLSFRFFPYWRIPVQRPRGKRADDLFVAYWFRERESIHCYIPAFRFSGAGALRFDRFAEMLTKNQPALTESLDRRIEARPVAVGPEEAAALHRAALAAAAPRVSERFFDFLKATDFSPGEPELLFLPLHESEHELTDGIFGKALAKNSLGL